jgi:hypothetical protein
LLVVLAFLATTVSGPAGAVHDQFEAETLLIPWQHDGETFTATVSQPFEVGARWGACTPELAADFTTWPDLTGPTLEVSGTAASWPAVGWNDPIQPATPVVNADPQDCTVGQPGDTFWWVYWRTPITFDSPGSYQVTLSMSTETGVPDGISDPPFRPDLSGTITVNVTPDLALFNPNNGQWNLRYRDGHTVSFFYGVPGDTPLMGDWDCDGTDTVAMYRESTGFIYYRNWNNFGIADGEFFFGAPGDIPIAGDWDNDGCDTFGIYRNGKVFLRNSLSTGFADKEFWFGVPGDRPFAGDFTGDRTDTIGLYRQSSGLAYFTADLPVGGVATTDNQFFYGIPSDRIIADDWDMDGDDSVGIFRPGDQNFYLSYENALGDADLVIPFGQSSWLPTGGNMVPLNPGDTVNCGDFTTQAQAQAWHDYYHHWYGDIANLDGDANGVACESL